MNVLRLMRTSASQNTHNGSVIGRGTVMRVVRSQPMTQPTACLALTPAPDPIAIQSADGKTFVATADIEYYEWWSHTITLAAGLRTRLLDELARGLVSGHPFRVVVKGETIYQGVITSGFSSFSFDSPVIDLTPFDLQEEQIRIQLGYPTEMDFTGEDPRGDTRIREALEREGKLKDSERGT